MTKLLVYTLAELAKELRTSKENVYQLEELGEIKSIQFSSCKVVSIYEAEHVLIATQQTYRQPLRKSYTL